MNKVLPAVIMAIGGASGAVGISYLAGAFDDPAYLSKDLGEFEKSKGGDCVKTLFPGLGVMNGGSVNTSIGFNSSFFNSQKKGEVDGCLVVNWDKDEYGTGNPKKWTGNFRFLWAARQLNGKGFIVFASATASKNETKELSWEGIAYSLTFDQTNRKWGWSGKKSAKSEAKTSSSNVDNKFPKAHTNLATTDKPFWGFMSGGGDMNNICGTSDCDNASTQTPYQGYWTWKGGEGDSNTQKLSEWTTNSLSDDTNSWWKEIYGDDSNWNIKEVVQNMTGKWTQKFPVAPISAE